MNGKKAKSNPQQISLSGLHSAEEVMHMFSKDLQEYDHNTVLYMIDELQDKLDAALAEKEVDKATIASLQARVKELESQANGQQS